MNMRFGDYKFPEKMIDLHLSGNITRVGLGSRPIECEFYTCLIVLTAKEELIVLFDQDLMTIDSISLSEIRGALKKELKKLD